MKNLLSLLSILTISGTAVSSVIAASPYQKHEQIDLENNKINFLERSTKQNNNKPIIINSYQSKNHTPITYNVNYNNYRSMVANWSKRRQYNNYSSLYLVVDWFDYADTFDKFRDKYPSVTIETNGKAISTSTFGDVGKGKFGTLHFDTITFNNDDIRKINIVDAYDSRKVKYNIYVKIGLGFKRLGSKLYLIPFIDGALYSVGAYKRYLDFGLDVSIITFNPKRDPGKHHIPITYNVNYYNYRSMVANWSKRKEYNDYSSLYLVVDYFDYADTFDKFRENYSSVTIETSGKAISMATFGDIGKGKFGTLHFDTINFNNNDIRKINIVDASDKKTAKYNIHVKIGLGFKQLGSKLYLIPFIDGALYSVGAYKRYLDFGLHIIVDCFDYAETFDKFRNNYPSVTIETNGKAISRSTFGDVGKGKFASATERPAPRAAPRTSKDCFVKHATTTANCLNTSMPQAH
ncbi:hypothetical protein DBV15_05812 [Temnothorax longispinosus]|uniref:Uncharacterized protein n=1 Tax=Temnothorax longispinosus TaxID=300112 RepID=A0A4S2JME4_9HYME|nr:hypothetical protein DBV15_05812 [Temnothorax longispinosus]